MALPTRPQRYCDPASLVCFLLIAASPFVLSPSKNSANFKLHPAPSNGEPVVQMIARWNVGEFGVILRSQKVF